MLVPEHTKVEGLGQWEAIVGAVVQAGTQAYAAKKAKAAQKKAMRAEAASAAAEERSEKIRMLQEDAELKRLEAQQKGAQKTNLLPYILIGGGVLVVGLAAVLLLRK